MLEIKNLCLQAGDFQVDQINFAVSAGNCHALVGATGSGKTLVLETVAGLRKVQSGSIHWAGRDITHLTPEQRKLAYVPQDLALFPHMTVRGNIEYGLRMQRNFSSDKYAELAKLTHGLGINHLLERSIKNLSGGERQRTALARALAPGNKLLLLDEPFSALHEAMRRELWLLLKTLQQQYGITILIVTHDMEEAFFLANSVTFIAGGKIIQSGEKVEVYRHPVNVEAAKFFGIQNLFPAEVTDESSERVTLTCPALGTILQVYNSDTEQLPAKTAVTVGIRAENIAVTADFSLERGPLAPNQLICVVKHVHQKRNGLILLLQPFGVGDVSGLMEVDLATSMLNQETKISAGQKVMVSLSPEHLFLFAD